MPSLNLDTDYFDHPKTVRLVQLLGRGSAEFPIRLWIYCSRYHRKDGHLHGYSPEQIEASLGWRGKAGLAVQALLTCGAHLGKAGFLEKTSDGYQVHDWEEHQGHLEKAHQAAKVAAQARWDRYRMRGARDPQCEPHAERNAPAGLGGAGQIPPVAPQGGRVGSRPARALVGKGPDPTPEEAALYSRIREARERLADRGIDRPTDEQLAEEMGEVAVA